MTWTTLDLYRAGLTFFTDVVDAVPDEAWDRPSPCAEWTARDVLGHVGEATAMGVRILRGGDLRFEQREPPSAAVDGDPVQWWHRLAEDARSTFDGDLDLDREVDSPMGRRTVREGLSFPGVDLFVHGWDLATATGRPVTIPDEAIAFTRQLFDHIPDEASRQPGVFAPALAVDPAASPTDQLVAFTGRDPSWSPPA